MVSDPVLDIRGVEVVDNEVVPVLLIAYVMLCGVVAVDVLDTVRQPVLV